MGEYEKPEDVEYKIQVSVNPNEKTITIRDNGLGMTEEEIDKYTKEREAHDNKVTEAEKELEGLREEENELNRGKPGKGESHKKSREGK